MNRAIAFSATLALVAALAACTPDIGGGAYFCGPERLCPDGLECDDPTFICVAPSSARDFECPTNANDNEPDNTLDDAVDLGTLRCGVERPLDNYNGCIDSAGDIDLFQFEYDDECSGADPKVRVQVRYPFAHAAIEIDLLDATGEVIQSAEFCTLPGDFTGSELLCMDARLTSGTYYLRFQIPSGTPDCDGDCQFSQFTANLTVPLS